MWYRRLLAVLFVVVGVSLPLAGQEKGDKTKKEDQDKKAGTAEKAVLKWKFEKGKPFYQTMKTETTQTMKVMNNNVEQKQDQTFYFSWTPEKQEGDNWVLKQKIEGVKMNIDIGGSKIAYDSTQGPGAAGNNPLADFFKALVGSEFTVTLNTKDMKVTNIEGRKGFLEKLVSANPMMKPLLEQILSENALREMAQPTFAAVPNKEVNKGESWTRDSTLDMGPIGKYENKYKYTFEGKDPKDSKLDVIKVDTTLKYIQPGENAGAGGLPFKIKGADLKTTHSGGTIKFDPDKGRVEESKSKLELKGDLTIEIGGQSTKVDLSQTQTTEVTTSDKNPVQEKK
jgi:hypothetical protein